MKFILVVVFLLISFHAVSAQKTVLYATNSLTETKRHFHIITDENGDIESLFYVIDEEDEEIEERHISYEDFLKGDIGETGIFKDFFKIRPQNFSRHKGGHIILKYPYNFLKNEIRTVEIDLVRNGGEWNLQKDGLGPFNNCNIIINGRIVPVGAKELVFSKK
ncbi:MAG: hypothetical protein KAQ98_09435 [Bacteriovoracaceae bacterium]|nr:hypothetical protein [Bacteriovoracaceae bacterium]